jgi:hypothetical protein
VRALRVRNINNGDTLGFLEETKPDLVLVSSTTCPNFFMS